MKYVYLVEFTYNDFYLEMKGVYATQKAALADCPELNWEIDEDGDLQASNDDHTYYVYQVPVIGSDEL